MNGGRSRHDWTGPADGWKVGSVCNSIWTSLRRNLNLCKCMRRCFSLVTYMQTEFWKNNSEVVTLKSVVVDIWHTMQQTCCRTTLIHQNECRTSGGVLWCRAGPVGYGAGPSWIGFVPVHLSERCMVSLEFIIKGFGIFSRLHCLFGQFLLRGGARRDHSLGEC